MEAYQAKTPPAAWFTTATPKGSAQKTISLRGIGSDPDNLTSFPRTRSEMAHSAERVVSFIANLSPIYHGEEILGMHVARSLMDGTVIVPSLTTTENQKTLT